MRARPLRSRSPSTASTRTPAGSTGAIARRAGWRCDSHDAELASRLLSEAAARLEARIDGPAWRVAHDNPGHSEARRRAARDARAKAEEYAEALGGRVGALVSVAEPGSGPSIPQPRMYAVHQEISGMPLEAGEHELVAEIDVTFQLEQG